MPHKMKKTHLLLTIALLGLPACSEATEISCPESIAVNQSSDKAPKGWEAVNDKASTFFLDKVALYAGHPSEMASLVPDNDDDYPQKSVWTFGKGKKGDMWLACQYRNTSMMLAQPIPANASTCIVEYKVDTSSQPYGIKKITLK
jgi:hypothetical protein